MEKEVSEVERKRSVKKKYTEQISSLLSHNVIAQQELYALVREFFSELLKLEYEFTYEELSSELNKIFLKSALKKDIDDFLYDLSESEYFLEKDLEPEQVHELVIQFQGIVKSMIYDAEVQEHKQSFFDKLFNRNKPPIIAPSETHPADDVNNEDVVDDATSDNSNDVISSDNISTNKSVNVKVSDEDRGDVKNENELFKQKLFRDHGSAEINSNAQDANILLTFDSADDDTEDLKSGLIKSGSMTTSDKGIVRRTEKPKKEQKVSKKTKSEELPLSKSDDESLIIEKKSQKPNVKSNRDSRIVDMPTMRPDIAKQIAKNQNLLIEDNSPDMVTVHEFMEESYLYMNNSDIDDAKRSYLKALDIYHKLSVIDKKSVYNELYVLFKKLKPL